MKLEVHTIRTGTPEWLVICGQTLDDWTARHNYPLRIWTELDDRPEYPCLKFCVTEMWKCLLEGDSDWLVYIDGDIYIRHDAPTMEFLKERSGMLVPRSPRRVNGRFDWWCRHYGATPVIERMKHWGYRNIGWFALDRSAAERLLRVVAPPYHEGTLDECQVNYWLANAVDRHGLEVSSPPREWHQFYWQRGPGWMWHLARPANKLRHLERIKREQKVS